MDEALSQPLLDHRRALAKARRELHPTLPPLSQEDLNRVRDNAANGLPLWHRVWENPKTTPNYPDFSEITRGIARSS